MKLNWSIATWVALGILGSLTFGISLSRQTSIQNQMNQTMSQLNQSIYDTNTVVAKTTDVLDPLANTTTALAKIEVSEQKTVLHLVSMNNHLAKIGQTESNIISELLHLNETTSAVGLVLTSAQSLNRGVLENSSLAYRDAVSEGHNVAQLTTLTPQATEELRALNHRLAVLRLMP